MHFQSLPILVKGLLVEVEYHLVSEHLPDNPDELTGTVPEGIIMCPALRHLFVIVILEGGVVLHDIVCCVHECVPEHSGAAFGHPGAPDTVIARLIDRRVQTGKGKQLIGAEKR